MMTINDLTIEELIRVADDASLTPEQSKKIKIFTIGKLQELEQSGQLTEEQKKWARSKVKELKADVYGVDDMGYPYMPQSKEQAKRNINVPQHVDMYCGSESLN